MIDKVTGYLNRFPPLPAVLAFLLIVIAITSVRIAPYQNSMSALIGMQQEFFDLNPHSGFDGLVVLKDSGYDGEFFYMIARYLYDPDMPLPVMDTFRLRMNRIGMPLVTGFFTNPFGWQYYALISTIILYFSFVLSYLALRAMLREEFRYLSLFYLFSPFSLNSTLLLVSDSLMVSVALLGLYSLHRAGFRLTDADTVDRISIRSKWIWLTLILFCFLVSVRDTALFFLAPLGLIFLIRRDRTGMALIGIPVLVYLGLLLTVRGIETHPGTNPVYYERLFTWPLQGFAESLVFSGNLSPKTLARETSKFLNLAYALLLIYNLRNVRSVHRGVLAIPLLLIALLSIIAVREYWETFDNVSRMFALSLPWIILLKNSLPGYRTGGILHLAAMFFLLLVLRNVWLKSPMVFSVVGM